MKRSEINQLIIEAGSFFKQHQFVLPEWAYWEANNWKGKQTDCREIADNMLGWDLTDFGSGDFKKRGLILFTIRNGNIKKDKKVYCEKIMVVDVNQETPLHFHWNKTEDIINRGGGNLVMHLYHADNKEGLDQKEVYFKIDGIAKKANAGEKVVLLPGQSICLEPYMYHRFYAENQKTLVGEVSAVNDDTSDNRFYENIGRFPEIIEDVAPLHLLVSDYKKYF